MDIREAVVAATFAGLITTGMVLTAADAVSGQIDIDGVTISTLASEDYMPQEP